MQHIRVLWTLVLLNKQRVLLLQYIKPERGCHTVISRLTSLVSLFIPFLSAVDNVCQCFCVERGTFSLPDQVWIHLSCHDSSHSLS